MTEKYFTTGEFASLCSTTKETLFHYDKIGILKPAHIDKNRYRYYSPKQFADFDLIATLKDAGCSLKQIKEYMETYTPDKYLDVLEYHIKKLQKEQKKLKRKERILEKIKLSMKYAMDHPCGIPKLEACEEEYLIVIKLDQSSASSEKEEIYKLSDHFDYCYSNNIGDSFTLGSIVLKETLLSDKSHDSYYYSKISEPICSERLFIKPKGTYLTMLHKGSIESVDSSYQIMLDYIEQHNLILIGNAYIDDLLGCFATASSKQFISQISMEVALMNDHER